MPLPMADRYSEYRRVLSRDAEDGTLNDAAPPLDDPSNVDEVDAFHAAATEAAPTTTTRRRALPPRPGPQWGPKELSVVFASGALAGALLVAALLGPPAGRRPADVAPLLTSFLNPAAASHQNPAASATAPTPRRVLFVGNSFTYGPPAHNEPANTLYNLPAMVRVIAESLGQVR